MIFESYHVTNTSSPPVQQVELEVRQVQEVHKVKASTMRKSGRNRKASQKVRESQVIELSMDEAHVAELSLINQIDGPCSSPIYQLSFLCLLTVKSRQECQVCGERSTTLCSDCRGETYCNRLCQFLHWNMGHRSMCKSTTNNF